MKGGGVLHIVYILVIQKIACGRKRKKCVVCLLDPKKNSRRRYTIGFKVKILIHKDPAKVDYVFETKASKKWIIVLKTYMSRAA